MSDLYDKQHDAEIVRLNDRITELEASLADSNEALQVMGLKLAQAEGHSANTVGEREACPACGDDVEHVWCLISPEGKRFTGDTKMAAYREEASSRIPATEQLANIMRANAECEAEYQADLEQARKQGYQSGYAAGLEVNSANTVGVPTPVMDAAPACEQLADNEDAVYAVAYKLCLQDGADEDSAHTLIWEGHPPEPWGEVWMRYEFQARELLKALDERRALMANHQATFQSGHECVSRVSNSDSQMNKQDDTRTAGESDR